MATKLQIISELSERTASHLTDNHVKWTSFLKTAAANYKYSFFDQVLIFAQRPNATACAEIELWNKQLKRWVNKGAKGIALIDERGNKALLRHVFDITDTHDRFNRPVSIWQMDDKYTDAVVESLENTFGELESAKTLTSAVISAVKNAVHDNFTDYYESIINAKEDSFLEELDDLNVDARLKETLKSSVAFMVLYRCGINPDNLYTFEDFQYIVDFNTLDTISVLGTASSDISETVLNTIGDTVKKAQLLENRQIRTFANSRQLSNNIETNQTTERNERYDINLSNNGRLPATQPNDAGIRSENNARKVWDVAQDIPQRTQEGNLQSAHDIRQIDESLQGNRRNSETAFRADDVRDVKSTGRDGIAQIDRPNEMGTDDEQYQGSSGGNHLDRADLQLEYYDRETEDKSLPFFHSDILIKTMLNAAPHLSATKKEIFEFFALNDDNKARTEFVKSIFNNDYTELIVSDEKRVGYKTYQNVLHIWEGSYNNRIAQGYYDWGVIANYFAGMILTNELRDVIKPLPSVSQQMTILDAAEDADKSANKSSAYLFSQEIIDFALQRGSGVQDGKYRIYEQFSKKQSNNQNERFLSNEYGIGGSSPILSGTGISEWHDGKGITLSRNDEKLTLSWSKAAKRIGELIEADRYLNGKEKEYFPAYLAEQQQRRQEAEEGRIAREILAKAPPTIPAEQENLEYSFSLGDNIYLGADAYEILAYDDNVVRLFDTKFPMFNKEIPRSEFDRKLRENPSNNHLLQKQEPQTDNPIWLDYQQIKSKYPDDILMYENGDFFEFLGKDADIASDELGLTLTSRDIGNEKVPMCGIPAYKLEEYMQQLLDNAHNVILHSRGSTSGKIESIKVLCGVGLKKEEHHPVGRIDHIGWKGEVVESQEYDITTELEAEIRERTDIGEPFEAVVYNGTEQISDFLETFVKEDYKPIPEPLAIEEPIKPTWNKPKPKGRVHSYDIHPDIPLAERSNFRITNDNLGVGTPREKFQSNVDAIRLLKQLEFQNRFATPDEQEILSKYVGWGGLSDTFDEKKWPNEYLVLRNLLDEQEYSTARESTLSAFYTPPIVIKSIYQAIENMGFKTGNILEPSCGIGNFLGLIPDSLSDCKMYGVELDSITGRIAQQLYQKSSIAVQGYEKTNLPDSFFDLAIGNVPFGQFKVADKRYDKNNFLIHDYFFAKTLDKVRPGGVVAFITSKGTLDKENPAVRKYIAQRADLLGAIRLPNNAFKANAGTDVTADIIFLQKRDRLIDIEPSWVHLGKDENGIVMNNYFIENPDMLMGEMIMESTQYGMDSTCKPYNGQNLEIMLSDAIANIHAEIAEYETEDLEEETDNSISADPNVRNFSFTTVDDKIYFRENSRMKPIDAPLTTLNRIKSMIDIRDSVRALIEYQTEDYDDSTIQTEQKRLNNLYDAFNKKYGLINSRANNSAFSDDSSYCLLCSLEVIDENGDLVRKADMFSKRTIKQRSTVTSVDTAVEALALSLSEKARVDMEFMSKLTGKTEKDIAAELEGIIFRNPTSYNDGGDIQYETANEYLSGNVREKLRTARQFADMRPDIYAVNVKALEEVQPVDLTASEIAVRLGATWIPPEIVENFMFELLGTPRYNQWNIKVHYSAFTAQWNIEGKSVDRANIKSNNTYGTSRINAYKIIEETLNLKDVRIFDTTTDADGKKTQVLNKKETAIAGAKQELIKTEFAEWIWRDPERREMLTKMYNEKFNSVRPREYDGSHLHFSGMNPEITLRPHQVNAVAHIMYGGNTLLAHEVGAGKTYTMTAAAMESKRLGLCQKSLFVVPNHITEQWSAEFLQLYPSANILVATKKDFEAKNRKKFCGRIATGDYDAVIIGHTQFEKIPMSIERQQAILRQQLDEIIDGIADLKHNRGENFSIKQLEKTKKSIQLKIEKLNDQSRKDDVVTFEELGVDRIFVDESHYYKNLFLYTKMRNVGGISQTEAQKSSDLFMKCRYLDEITGGRGTVFATGTPISNSMVEMYTNQRYLQYNTLVKNGLQHFDAWASTFGETVTAIELAPEGTGYRAKTRFAKFYNLPELMSMFKEVADIQTADMLNLPVPKANYHNVSVKPTEMQKEMVAELSERADRVRNKMVDSSVDNMLKITNDGRKLALDQRLMNEILPDDENSKVSTCVNNIFNTWETHKDKNLTQLVFCDLSTPHYDDKFNVYDDIKKKLINKGIPENEVAFIHDADNETQKKELFAKVRKGYVRVLLGSTQKMGAGTNVQDKLIALHDLDCPWRPADLQQRAGRIVRQGNKNPKVDLFRYVTENTFDAYLYQLVENKQRFIGQIMTSKSPVRSAEDIDETALSYAEIKALATGNPYIKEKMDLDIAVAKLKLLKANYLSQKYSLEDSICKYYPQQIKANEERIQGLKKDTVHLIVNTKPNADGFCPMLIKGITYTEKVEAGKAILEACKAMTSPDATEFGEYRGFSMLLSFDSFSREYKITLHNELSHSVSLGADTFGNITRIDNVLEGFETKQKACEEILENTKMQLENAKTEVNKPFAQDNELKSKSARLDELNILLNMDKEDNEIIDGEPDECIEDVPTKAKKVYVR